MTQLIRKILILLVLVFLNPILSKACSCKWGGNFIKTEKYSELTVIGKILQINTYNELTKKPFEYDIELDQEHVETRSSILIEIRNVLKGSERRNIIEVFGSNGSDCLESVNAFKVGNHYLFSIDKYEKSFISQTKGGIYKIEGCSEKWLRYNIENKEVYGRIRGKRLKRRIYMDLKKLQDKLKLTGEYTLWPRS